MRRFRRFLLFLGVLLSCADVVWAVSIPDAGRIFREQKELAPRVPEQLAPPEGEEEERQEVSEDGPRVLVKGFRFTGFDGIVDEAALQGLVKEAVGKEQSLADLRRLTRRVAAYLREKNFLLARAYLPRQDVTEGIVEIAVIAGRSEGEATILPDGSRRLRDSVLRGLIGAGVRPGEPLRGDDLERAVLLMNDIPGISARGILEQGDTPGTTRVLIEAVEGPLFGGNASVDNFGNRYTGALRGATQIVFNDALGLGDELRLGVTGAEDFYSGAVSYSLPVGSSGLRAGVGYSGLYYELGKEFSALDADGRADALSFSLHYPLVRTRAFSFWQGFTYAYRDLEDRIENDVVRDHELSLATFEWIVSASDRFGGGGLTSARVGFTVGGLKLGIDADAAADAAGPGSEGRFSKFTYSFSRLQRLTNHLTAFGALNGQFASQNLDSSEKFILGGPTAVRAYPVGEAAGDEGHSLTLELRYDLPVTPRWSDIQLVTFFDAGNITLYADPWNNAVISATGENDYWLYGGGFGVNLGKAGRYALRTSFAHTLGNNPGRSLEGNNADGKDGDSRAWVQGVVWF